MQVTRDDVLRFRVRAQELHQTGSRDDAAILDLGVQDTGPDGAAWALELRGASVPAEDLVYAWTLRGAPHAYRRTDAAAVAAAVAPLSEADAAKRVFDASKPLKDAGIPVVDALGVIAGEMRDIVRTPTVKGEMSRELAERLPAPYLRWCRVCEATHSYEQTFRLSALPAGLELEPGTSPPVLHRIRGWRGAAKKVPDQLDPIRGGAALPRADDAQAGGRLRRLDGQGDQGALAGGRRAGRGRRRAARDPRRRCRRPGRRRAGGRRAAARPVRPVPPGAGPRARAPRCSRPQGPLAHHRPSGGVLVGHEVVGTAVRVVGQELRIARLWSGGSRRGPPSANAWPFPRPDVRRVRRADLRPARGSAPCPGRHPRTW